MGLTVGSAVRAGKSSKLLNDFSLIPECESEKAYSWAGCRGAQYLCQWLQLGERCCARTGRCDMRQDANQTSLRKKNLLAYGKDEGWK